MDAVLVVLMILLVMALVLALFVYPLKKFRFTQFGALTALMLFVVGILLKNGAIPPIAVIPIGIAWNWLRRNDEKTKKEVAEAVAAEVTRSKEQDTGTRAD